jgi:hypothetical protein
VNELEQLPFPLLGLRRYRDVLLGRQIIEERHHQRAEVRPVLIHCQGSRDHDIGLAPQYLVETVQGRGFAAADDARQRHQLLLGDRGFEGGDDLLVLGRLEAAYVAQVSPESVVGHHLMQHARHP